LLQVVNAGKMLFDAIPDAWLMKYTRTSEYNLAVWLWSAELSKGTFQFRRTGQLRAFERK